MPPRLDTITGQPWALMPATLAHIVDTVRNPVAQLPAPPQDGGMVRQGAVSVIPVHGVIENRSDWMMEMFGGTSIEGLRATLRAELADPSVKAIVLEVDSPGGTVAGITEFAAEIRNARSGTKPIVAAVNTLAASAAYWLASQADEIVITPSGEVGSIGVYAVHQEASRALDAAGITTTIVSAGPYKTEANEFEPLTDDAHADLQSRVDANYRVFLADVAAGRHVPVATVEADYGGGRVLPAEKARAAGMVDRVETLAQTVARLGYSSARKRLMGADAPFSERVTALADEAADLVHAAEHRARSRAADDRPAFSPLTETALRASRDAIDALLAGEPPAPEPTGEPKVPTPMPQPAALPPRRFVSRDDWLRHLEARH